MRGGSAMRGGDPCGTAVPSGGDPLRGRPRGTRGRWDVAEGRSLCSLRPRGCSSAGSSVLRYGIRREHRIQLQRGVGEPLPSLFRSLPRDALQMLEESWVGEGDSHKRVAERGGRKPSQQQEEF